MIIQLCYCEVFTGAKCVHRFKEGLEKLMENSSIGVTSISGRREMAGAGGQVGKENSTGIPSAYTPTVVACQGRVQEVGPAEIWGDPNKLFFNFKCSYNVVIL